jgi:hypothetical protein
VACGRRREPRDDAADRDASFRFGFDAEKLIGALKSIKGKALVSYQGSLTIPGYKKKTIEKSGRGIAGTAKQDLYFNFDRTKSYGRIEKKCDGFPELCTVCKAAPVSSEIFWAEAEQNYDVCGGCAETFVPKALSAVAPGTDLENYEDWPSLISVITKRDDSASDGRFAQEVPIIKADDEQRIVTGIVLQPNEVDAQNDTITPEIIRKAAQDFLARFGSDGGSKLGVMHKKFGDVGLELVESWIASKNETIGGQKVKAGSWLMSVRVKSDLLWKQVKAGLLTGFSIGGVASVVEPKAAE